nr:transposase [Paraburkholderia ultramafica]
MHRLAQRLVAFARRLASSPQDSLPQSFKTSSTQGRAPVL